MRGKYKKIKTAAEFKYPETGSEGFLVMLVPMMLGPLALGVISGVTNMNLQNYFFLFLGGCVAAYIQRGYVKSKNSLAKIIPISSKEWIWCYGDFYLRVIAGVLLFFVIFFGGISVFVGILNIFLELNMSPVELFELKEVDVVYSWIVPFVLGIRIMGINMITWGMKQKWMRVVAVILGYVIFTVTTILELNAWYDIKPVAVPICLTLLISLVWLVIGFVVTYYRIKPRKYIS